jgi:hypothetical protein
LLSCSGILLILFGLVLVWLSRDSEGFGRAAPLLLGLLLCAMGVYCAFFETGEGLARFLPWIKR